MTTVTLRKANELERGLLAAAARIKFDRTIEVSIHNDETVSDLVKGAQATLKQNLTTAVSLVRASHSIRAAISAANADSGINTLLGEKAALDAEEKIINQVVNGADASRRGRYDELDSASDIAVAQKQLEAARARASSAERFHGPETVTVRVLDAAAIEALSGDLAAIQLRKRGIADNLLSANMNTKVTLAPETVVLLKQFKLLA